MCSSALPEGMRLAVLLLGSCSCTAHTPPLPQGLEDVIGLSATHPTWQKTRPEDDEDTHWGWTFASDSDPPFSNSAGHGKIKPKTGLLPDTVNHAR